MRAGLMRHSVNFQVKTEAAAGLGANTVSWANSIAAMARVENLPAAERLESQRLTGRVPVRFVVYYDSGITTQHRIKWSPDGTDRYFTIQSIRDATGMRRTMIIDAVEDTDA